SSAAIKPNPRSDTSFLIVPVAIDGSSFPEPDRPHARACSRESHGERVPSGRYRLLTPGRSLVNPAEDPLPRPIDPGCHRPRTLASGLDSGVSWLRIAGARTQRRRAEDGRRDICGADPA